MLAVFFTNYLLIKVLVTFFSNIETFFYTLESIGFHIFIYFSSFVREIGINRFRSLEPDYELPHMQIEFEKIFSAEVKAFL